MTTLLVGLDNPHSEDPRFALYPRPEGATGDRIVELIAEHLGEYQAAAYLQDFVRANLYGIRRAATGPGQKRCDVDQAANVMLLAAAHHSDDVVLFGRRVTEAFEVFSGRKLENMESAVNEYCERPVRFWSVPHPSVRNAWYRKKRNRQQAGKLLASLRARKAIPYHELDEVHEVRPG